MIFANRNLDPKHNNTIFGYWTKDQRPKLGHPIALFDPNAFPSPKTLWVLFGQIWVPEPNFKPKSKSIFKNRLIFTSSISYIGQEQLVDVPYVRVSTGKPRLDDISSAISPPTTLMSLDY
jgi:hypothetical protein